LRLVLTGVTKSGQAKALQVERQRAIFAAQAVSPDSGLEDEAAGVASAVQKAKRDAIPSR
jgi:hypothetical protein